MDGMMSGMHGMMLISVLVGVALIALAVFLIRRSRPPAK